MNRQEAPLVLLAETEQLGKRWCADHMDALGWPPRKVHIVTTLRQLYGLGERQIALVVGSGVIESAQLHQARVMVATGSRWVVVKDGQLVEQAA